MCRELPYFSRSWFDLGESSHLAFYLGSWVFRKFSNDKITQEIGSKIG
jgi:hypothetical protein